VPPRLAREAVTAAALRGDSAALLAANAYLPAREAFRYDRRRVAAFATALSGDRELALSELGLGGGARVLRLGVDTAVVELLTRGSAAAVEALRLALRDGLDSEPDVRLVLAEAVRRDQETARAALSVALSGGSALERARAATAVLQATRFGVVEAAVPAMAAASLALAVFAFARLPGMIDGSETAAPRVPAPPPAVVVARPQEEPLVPARTKPKPRRPRPDAVVQVAVRTPLPQLAEEPTAVVPSSPPTTASPRPPTPSPEPTPPAPAEPAPPPTPPAPELSQPAAVTASAAPPPAPAPAEVQATWQAVTPVEQDDDDEPEEKEREKKDRERDDDDGDEDDRDRDDDEDDRDRDRDDDDDRDERDEDDDDREDERDRDNDRDRDDDRDDDDD
jgi:hypothetical protein